MVYDKKDKNGNWRYLRPFDIMKSELGERFEQVNDSAFEVYSEGVKRLIEYFQGEFPREKFRVDVKRMVLHPKVLEKDLETDDERKAFRIAYNFTVRCAALDVGRCVLPSSTLTHLGLFGNGRFYTNLISHLKTSSLYESLERGGKLEEELSKVIPTFIKRNRKRTYLQEIYFEMREHSMNLFLDITPEDDKVTLVPEAECIDQVVASALFPFAKVSLSQILDVVRELSNDKKLEILETYRGNRKTRFDRTGRGLEADYPITFDLVGGFAEYRDLERHRMLTQQRQLLTTDLGFIMPPEMGVVRLEKEVETLVDRMGDLNSDLKRAGFREASQYATLFNNRMRFMMGMNLREFQHLTELRTQPAGHFSYRSMVMEMTDKLVGRDPWAKTFLEFVDYSDPDNRISRAKEQSRIAGKNLAKGIQGDLDF